MNWIAGRLASAVLLMAVAAGSVPAGATDLEVVAPPPPPPPTSGYSYLTHGMFGKLVPVRAAPAAWSPMVYGLPSGIIPTLTGRCSRDLTLSSIASHSSWFRTAAISTRWCEVVSQAGGLTGWIRGSDLRAF